MLTTDDLRIVSTFADLDEADLAWLVERLEEHHFEPGEQPFERGAPAEEMMIMLEGTLQIFTFEGGQRQLYDTFGRGDISGLLPYSRMETYGGEGVITEPARMAILHKQYFREMLNRMPVLGKRLTAIMSDRVRESARVQQQHEKMMALGKLSAGLSHELNNPAASVNRAAHTLQEHLGRLPTLVANMAGCGISTEAICAADKIRSEVLERPRESLSTLDRSEREDILADWLADHQIAKPWMMAETFVDAGFTEADMEAIAEAVPPKAMPDVLAWIEGGLAADQLLTEITSGANRISELVSAVKSYTHMDRAPTHQPTDVREGLDSTLTMLKGKLKKKNIQVERDFEEVPAVEALPGALNQVWTNLIDNAIDAMDEGGTLRLVTRRDGLGACVEVIDDGPGIAPDIQSRIFEPFFTTKDVGEGTGLGLDIVHRIITRSHQGQVDVESEPGRTVFRVQLPAEHEPISQPAPTM